MPPEDPPAGSPVSQTLANGFILNHRQVSITHKSESTNTKVKGASCSSKTEVDLKGCDDCMGNVCRLVKKHCMNNWTNLRSSAAAFLGRRGPQQLSRQGPPGCLQRCSQPSSHGCPKWHF